MFTDPNNNGAKQDGTHMVTKRLQSTPRLISHLGELETEDSV